jgi:lysophospholipase L1-like esterase
MRGSMKKLFKILSVLLALAVFASCVSLLTACNETEEESEPLKIVFLGDSIGEGILGPSPISERDYYGYYGVIGKRNDYCYRNRAVSGHKTAQMLEYIQREDEGAEMTRTHIMDADVISISILGNDLLQNDLGSLVVEAANGSYQTAENLLAIAAVDFATIIETLKGYNPDAVIFMQTLYNPATPESMIINQARKDQLTGMGVPASDYRGLAKNILDRLNAIVYEYLEENPGAYHIIDVYNAFNDIYVADNARGNALFYNDWVHPSNQGHAVIADTMQKKLEELGLANREEALFRYKMLRYEQMLKLYPGALDFTAAADEIGEAESCDEVTEIYFRLTAGLTPTY